MPSRRAGALRNAAPAFAALGDETRLTLVARLGTGGPRSITQLASGFDVSRQAVTKHLRVLAEAGMVRSARRGRERLWRLRRERLDEIRRDLDLLSQQWDEALDRLKTHVEG